MGDESEGGFEGWFRGLLPRDELNFCSPKIRSVPRVMRNIESNKAFYEPWVISIGPYHRNNDNRMQRFKVLAARKYAESIHLEPKYLYEKVKMVAGEARKCYPEDATEGMSELEFARMMFLDGCFFLQFISRGLVRGMSRADRISVNRDLLLLENQLPFIILTVLESDDCAVIEKMTQFIQKRWSWRTPLPKKNYPPTHLLHLLREYLLVNPEDLRPNNKERSTAGSWLPLKQVFSYWCCTKNKDEHTANTDDRVSEEEGQRTNWHPNSAKELCSTTHKVNEVEGERPNYRHPNTSKELCSTRSCFPMEKVFSYWCCKNKDEQYSNTKSSNNAEEERPSWHTFRSAKELKKVGIDFRASETHSFSDVGFSYRSSLRIRGELNLPPMIVYDSTVSILLNLAAYEMSAERLDSIPDVSSYICLLDELIDHEDDVMELRSKGILINSIGSDKEVAKLFNNIATGLTWDRRAYGSVVKQIEGHCQSKLKIWVLERLYTHFEAPWSKISFIAAVIALALSFIQAYFTVIQCGRAS